MTSKAPWTSPLEVGCLVAMGYGSEKASARLVVGRSAGRMAAGRTYASGLDIDPYTFCCQFSLYESFGPNSFDLVDGYIYRQDLTTPVDWPCQK